jgi:hypothetical protein
MSYEDEVEEYELAMDDHSNMRDLLSTAISDVQDGVVDAEDALDAVYGALDDVYDDAEAVVEIAKDYLMKDTQDMNDEALELSDTADRVEATVDAILDDAGAADIADLGDALTPSTEHEDRVARMRRKVNSQYFN